MIIEAEASRKCGQRSKTLHQTRASYGRPRRFRKHFFRVVSVISNSAIADHSIVTVSRVNRAL